MKAARTALLNNKELRTGFFILLACLASAPLVFGAPRVAPIAIGVALLGFGVHALVRFRRVATWPSVPASLERSGIGTRDVWESQYAATTYYFPEVTFSYRVQGISFTSDTYALDPRSTWTTDSSSVTATLRALKNVELLTARVNPARLDQAVLEWRTSKRRREHACSLVISGLIIVLFGVWLLAQA